MIIFVGFSQQNENAKLNLRPLDSLSRTSTFSKTFPFFLKNRD